MKKKNVKTTVIATVLAAVCAVSAGATISSISASAATVPTASVSANARNSRVYYISFKGKTSYGYDWDYRADSTSAKISCSYKFATQTYTFTAAGNYKGITNAVIKYATIDGKWHNVPMRFTVDNGLNVTGQQTGKEYVTSSRSA